MLKLVKGFKNMLPESIQFIVFVVLSVLAIVLTVWNEARILDFIESLLPTMLIIFGVLILYRKKQVFLAHFILFFLIYRDKFGIFIDSILSYNFANNAFIIKPDLMMFLYMIGSLYLILYLVSHVFDGKLKFDFKYTKSVVLLPLIAMILYAYFNNSFLTAVIWSLPVVISLLVGSPIAAMMFLTCNFIAIPFNFLDILINFSGVLKFRPISYWIFLAVALYILVLAVLTTIKILKEPVEK